MRRLPLRFGRGKQPVKKTEIEKSRKWKKLGYMETSGENLIPLDVDVRGAKCPLRENESLE